MATVKLQNMNFTPPAVEKTVTTTKRDAFQLGVAVREGTVSGNDGSDLNTSRFQTTERAGKSYNIKPLRLPKAVAFWFKKSGQRKIPGNCSRCGKPNPDNAKKSCPACRSYQKRYKDGKRGRTVIVYQSALDHLEHRIAALEHSLALLQVNSRVIYKRGYNRGLRTGREIRHYAGTLKPMTIQELATISHVYSKP